MILYGCARFSSNMALGGYGVADYTQSEEASIRRRHFCCFERLDDIEPATHYARWDGEDGEEAFTGKQGSVNYASVEPQFISK